MIILKGDDMKTELAKTLIQKGIIRERTTIEAYYFAHGLSCADNSRVLGEFYILRAKKRGDDFVFDVFNGENAITVKAQDILSVDGMDEPRLAEAYMLTETGDIIPEGKRRGRKPKGYIDHPQQIADIIRLNNFGWKIPEIAEKLKIEEERVLEVLEVENGDYDDGDWADTETSEDEDWADEDERELELA